MTDMTPWQLQALEVVTCNCAFGCPCQFNALPTEGHCRAGIGYLIERGRFGDTDLAGVSFAGLFAWPGPIHQGSGEALLVVDEKASEAQRAAVEAIFRGEHTVPGGTIFNVFSNVIDTYHPTQFRPVEVEGDMEARQGKFVVHGLVEGAIEPIRNPVTGEPHRARSPSLPDSSTTRPSMPAGAPRPWAGQSSSPTHRATATSPGSTGPTPASRIPPEPACTR